MERLVAIIADSIPAPLFYHSGQKHYGFRYGNPKLIHFCLLKAVRSISALNAMIVLARGGFSQEINVLVRTLVECTTHIEFVLAALSKDGTLRPEVSKYVNEYFYDYVRNDHKDFKRAQVNQRDVHRKLAETLKLYSEQNDNEAEYKTAEMTYSNVYMTYSAYVHSKYPEVMDMYGGDPGHFHLNGMLGTPKELEIISTIDTFIDTVAAALKIMVIKLQLGHVIEPHWPLSIWIRSV